MFTVARKTPLYVIIVIFAENASFRSYVICLPQMPLTTPDPQNTDTNGIHATWADITIRDFNKKRFVQKLQHIRLPSSWTPHFGEVLPVKRELTNEYDRFAVAVLKDGEVVGHVPQALSKETFFFLRYDGNVAFCEVTGKRLNRALYISLLLLSDFLSCILNSVLYM